MTNAIKNVNASDLNDLAQSTGLKQFDTLLTMGKQCGHFKGKGFESSAASFAIVLNWAPKHKMNPAQFEALEKAKEQIKEEGARMEQTKDSAMTVKTFLRNFYAKTCEEVAAASSSSAAATK